MSLKLVYSIQECVGNKNKLQIKPGPDIYKAEHHYWMLLPTAAHLLKGLESGKHLNVISWDEQHNMCNSASSAEMHVWKMSNHRAVFAENIQFSISVNTDQLTLSSTLQHQWKISWILMHFIGQLKTRFAVRFCKN